MRSSHVTDCASSVASGEVTSCKNAEKIDSHDMDEPCLPISGRYGRRPKADIQGAPPGKLTIVPLPRAQLVRPEKVAAMNQHGYKPALCVYSHLTTRCAAIAMRLTSAMGHRGDKPATIKGRPVAQGAPCPPRYQRDPTAVLRRGNADVPVRGAAIPDDTYNGPEQE